MNNLESMVIVITLQNFQIITRLLGTFFFFLWLDLPLLFLMQ
jgi:hypothetical protein